MKATEAKLLDLLKKAPQFVIPIYQRTYSWTEKECRQLWDDIVRTGGNDAIAVHFIGSIVYVEQGLGGPGPVTVTVFSPQRRRSFRYHRIPFRSLCETDQAYLSQLEQLRLAL
jgi:hypothetical protein